MPANKAADADVTSSVNDIDEVTAPRRRPIGRSDRWEVVMIGVALIVFLGIFALSVLVLVLSRSASRDYEAVRTRLHQPGAETLSYDVPNGQDVAELIVALDRAGYPAVEETGGTRHQVLVSCPHGRDQARPYVRAVLGGIGGSTKVRFIDEL
jgi:hypothetical protein